MDPTEQPITDSAPKTVQEKLEAMFDDGDESSNEATAAPAGEEQATEQTEGTQDDSEDVEFEGLNLKLPREAATKLKSAVEGYKDYTKKTQEVAEQRRMVEAQTKLFQEQQAFQASITPELSAFQQIDSQLAEYRKLDWTALPMEQAMQYRVQFDLLKDKKEELGRQLQGKQQEFNYRLANHKAALRDAQEKAVKMAIPGWKPETGKKLADYATDQGYSDSELGNSYDPRLVVLLHKAQQWDALQASKPGVTQRANSAPPTIRPGAASTQPSKAIQTMNFRKLVKSAPDSASKARLIQERLESKF